MARKVFELLKTMVKPDATDKVADPKLAGSSSYEMDGEGIGLVQSCFLLLTNISMEEEGQKHCLGEGVFKGVMLENLLGMFTYFSANASFDFVANTLANVTSLKEGRKWLIESGNLDKIADLLVRRTCPVNDHRRKYLVHALRNCMFENEQYEMDFRQVS